MKAEAASSRFSGVSASAVSVTSMPSRLLTNVTLIFGMLQLTSEKRVFWALTPSAAVPFHALRGAAALYSGVSLPEKFHSVNIARVFSLHEPFCYGFGSVFVPSKRHGVQSLRTKKRRVRAFSVSVLLTLADIRVISLSAR